MNKDELKKAAAVLSVSMITILGSTAVSPALSGIKNAFPEIDDSVIQMVLTIPPLFIIPSCFLCKLAIEKFGQKRVLLLGLFIYLLGGLGAGLMPGFYSMLFMRAMLGIGCGFITPIAQSLISSNFSGSLRERLTGYSASASYLMGILASFTVGRLAGIHWRLAFTIYFVAVLVLILNVLFLPDQKQSRGSRKVVRKGINWPAMGTICCMSLINVAFYTFSTSISLFIQQENIGETAISGNIVAVFMCAGFIMGLFTSNIRKHLKQFTMALGCLMMGIGYTGLGLGHHILIITISSALIGASYSVFYSGIFVAISRLSRSSEENTTLVSYTTAGMFFGQSISVYILEAAESLSGMSGYRFRFAFLATGLFFSGICVIATGIHRRCIKEGITNEKIIGT